MPIYEFRCNECKREFEFLQLSADEIVYCPNCQSKNLQKLISSFIMAKKEGTGSSSSSCSSCSATSCRSCKLL